MNKLFTILFLSATFASAQSISFDNPDLTIDGDVYRTIGSLQSTINDLSVSNSGIVGVSGYNRMEDGVAYYSLGSNIDVAYAYLGGAELQQANFLYVYSYEAGPGGPVPGYRIASPTPVGFYSLDAGNSEISTMGTEVVSGLDPGVYGIEWQHVSNGRSKNAISVVIVEEAAEWVRGTTFGYYTNDNYPGFAFTTSSGDGGNVFIFTYDDFVNIADAGDGVRLGDYATLEEGIEAVEAYLAGL